MRRIIKSGISESIRLPELSFDVLLQHLVSLACGPGFNPITEKERIKDCWSYRNLNDKIGIGVLIFWSMEESV